MAKKKIDVQKNETPKKLKIDFIKSNFFRVIHADGIWGGLTPSLDIQMAFFNERSPIPQQITHPVIDNIVIDNELKDERITRDSSLVREIEVSVLIDIDTAKRIREWLNEKIDAAEKIKNELKQKNKG